MNLTTDGWPAFHITVANAAGCTVAARFGFLEGAGLDPGPFTTAIERLLPLPVGVKNSSAPTQRPTLTCGLAAPRIAATWDGRRCWLGATPRHSQRRLLITPAAPKPKIAVVDDDARMRGSIVAALRSTFEVVEGADYEAAYKLLQEAGLDVLLLALPMESGGLHECTELLNRLAVGDIDTLVIVLSTD